jgi:hypothetical protein
MAKNPAAILYDSSGNAVGVVLDGAVYRLQLEAKVARASDGAYVNPSTEETLTSIKDTDGIKKITDQLPAGTNEIGKVAQGTKAAAADAWPQALFDSLGVELAVVDDTSIPAGTRALLASGRDASGNAQHLRLDGNKNLKVTNVLPTPPGAATAVIIAQPENELEIAGGVQNPHDTDYLIPSGQTFFLQVVSCGAAGDPSEDGSRVDVVYYDGTTEHIVTRMYLAGQTVYEAFPDSSHARDGTTMSGDGSTKKIILRRIRLSQATQEVDAEVRGYVE